MIKKISSYYWQVSTLKDSPANTPYSIVLMLLSALLFISIMTIQWSIADLEFFDESLEILLTALSLALSFAAYSFVLLFFKNLGSRFVQTITCLLFAESIIHLFAIPLFIMDPYLQQANLKNPIFLFIGVIYLFTTFGLSVWQFVITAHIYKYALNTTATQSVLAAFGLIAVNILTISLWR
jgi:hypothetical protein